MTYERIARHMPRQFTWLCKMYPARLIVGSGDAWEAPREISMYDLGYVQVSGAPIFDTGRFVVIDTVKDLEYAVVDAQEGAIGRILRIVHLDVLEAIRIAMEFQEVADNESENC